MYAPMIAKATVGSTFPRKTAQNTGQKRTSSGR